MMYLTDSQRDFFKCQIKSWRSQFMSCTAWNLKKLMEVLGEKAARFFARFLFRPFFHGFSGLLTA